MEKGLLTLPYISRDVEVAHYGRLCFLNAASVPHADTLLCLEALKMHTNTHRSAWDKCLHVCLELKGIWMCTVIGAEAGSLLWVTHAQSPCHAGTHTVIHTLAHKKGLRGNVRGKRAVMTLDFPILLQQCSFLMGAVQILTCKRAYKHTKLTYNLAFNFRGEKRQGLTE